MKVASFFGLRPRISGLLFLIIGVIALITILVPNSDDSSTTSTTRVPPHNIYSNYGRIKEQAAIDYLDLRFFSLGVNRLKEFPLCGKERDNYVPCYNITETDRNCEFVREGERCVVRPPRDYKIPLRWPVGRDIIWTGNVKITKDQFLSSGTMTKRYCDRQALTRNFLFCSFS